ncbi:hypothetical protein BJ508DRAFT_350113 [Ascobolus immersus RN42]|uniref:Uncharacterized protein n=1 Tax=Ascobolus immersus RN42 TaxID=1160509 RepID=A0A3N4HXD7_ASCIM|nr:hypothetical protein BJ508DRAFT_350113 [Ascobolus immersus RN42]
MWASGIQPAPYHGDSADGIRPGNAEHGTNYAPGSWALAMVLMARESPVQDQRQRTEDGGQACFDLGQIPDSTGHIVAKEQPLQFLGEWRISGLRTEEIKISTIDLGPRKPLAAWVFTFGQMALRFTSVGTCLQLTRMLIEPGEELAGYLRLEVQATGPNIFSLYWCSSLTLVRQINQAWIHYGVQRENIPLAPSACCYSGVTCFQKLESKSPQVIFLGICRSGKFKSLGDSPLQVYSSRHVRDCRGSFALMISSKFREL